MRRSYTRRPRLENISLEDFKFEKMRLEGLGLKVNAILHEWLHIRSLYFPGNLLEFVSYDASVGDSRNAGMHSKSALTSFAFCRPDQVRWIVRLQSLHIIQD